MFARGRVYLHTPLLLGRKFLEAKSRVSTTSKLIETKGLQVHYFGHLRKTGGEGELPAGTHGPGNSRDVPIEFFKLAGGVFNSQKPLGWPSLSVLVCPAQGGMGGPLFAGCVVADLQVGAFALHQRRIASLKTGHYKIEQREIAPSPVSAPGLATGLKTLALFGIRDAPPAHSVKSLTAGPMTSFYGKNDPFRSWPISANELEEVAIGSETSV